MRVADYIFRYLADYGVKHVFLVVGGGAMHLNDALSREKRIKPVCMHHEQAAAMAAEGYARQSQKLAVVNITSGPGGTNTLTGVIGQWLDSVPVLYISGQVKYETTISSAPGTGLRQLGDQEINIVDIVRPVTKYAKMVTDPLNIKIELDKAIQIATSGRPGPVWLDIPLNIQGALIEESGLRRKVFKALPLKPKERVVSSVIKELVQAKRPLLVVGHGVRIAAAQKEILDLIDLSGIPVVTTFNGFDLISSGHSNFIGRIGTLGSRAGNFVLQNADLIICLGTRNNIRQVSYNWVSFAKQAKKIIVDIDKPELRKKTVKGDILVHADAKYFISRLLERLPSGFKVNDSWLKWCLERKARYPVVLKEYKSARDNSVHPYHFIEELTSMLKEGACLVASNGTACVALFQAGIVKKSQRIFWNSGCASMGYGLPASIGACLAAGREVVCIEGDGSIQMNLQELQTVKHYNIPIKLFILNNHGYRSIELTQSEFFKGNFIGCNKDSGVSFPDFEKVAALYGLSFYKISSTSSMKDVINSVLCNSGPAICEVTLDKDYVFAPKLSSKRMPDGRIESSPLEDLAPFLEREEFKSNMISRSLEE